MLHTTCLLHYIYIHIFFFIDADQLLTSQVTMSSHQRPTTTSTSSGSKSTTEATADWKIQQTNGFEIRCQTYASKPGAKHPAVRHVLSGTGEIHLSHSSSMLLYDQMLSETVANSIQKELDDHRDHFQSPLISVFGRTTPIPRGQLAFGNGTYSYSNLVVPAIPSPPNVSRFLKTVQELMGSTAYKYILVNRYEGGGQKIGRHADDETDLFPEAPILSYSLGTARRFVVRSKKCLYIATKAERTARGSQLEPPSKTLAGPSGPSGPFDLHTMFLPSTCLPARTDLHHLPYSRISFEVSAGHNTLIAMCGRFQKEFVHEVPIEKKVTGTRYNLTVRATR
jgi:alkylated DNA repair dioxygenase AlkB